MGKLAVLSLAVVALAVLIGERLSSLRLVDVSDDHIKANCLIIAMNVFFDYMLF